MIISSDFRGNICHPYMSITLLNLIQMLQFHAVPYCLFQRLCCDVFGIDNTFSCYQLISSIKMLLTYPHEFNQWIFGIFERLDFLYFHREERRTSISKQCHSIQSRGRFDDWCPSNSTCAEFVNKHIHCGFHGSGRL